MPQTTPSSERVLAIDPGYERLGIAVIEKVSTPKNPQNTVIVFSECFITSAQESHDTRLLALGKEVACVIKKYRPTDMAIEQLFFNANQKTALSVAEARGVILYEAAKAKLEIYEYTPLEIKMAVTGYGRSSKNQLTEMVKKLIAVDRKEKILDDEFDAIAVGLTHLASKKFLTH